MSFNVKIIYPEKLISVGDLVKTDPLYLPQELAFRMDLEPLEYPLGVILKVEDVEDEKRYRIGYPEGTCTLTERAIILC